MNKMRFTSMWGHSGADLAFETGLIDCAAFSAAMWPAQHTLPRFLRQCSRTLRDLPRLLRQRAQMILNPKKMLSKLIFFMLKY